MEPMNSLSTSWADMVPLNQLLAGAPVTALHPASVREHHRLLDLTLRYRPVTTQEFILLLSKDAKPLTLIEANCPCGSGPGAYQQRSFRKCRNVIQQRLANPPSLLSSQGVR